MTNALTALAIALLITIVFMILMYIMYNRLAAIVSEYVHIKNQTDEVTAKAIGDLDEAVKTMLGYFVIMFPEHEQMKIECSKALELVNEKSIYAQQTIQQARRIKADFGTPEIRDTTGILGAEK